MGRQNKKENIAALHRETILKAAEQIFLGKGFSTATIDDISKASGYSRRTLYTYFDSKEDILYHIILNGLVSLKENILKAISENTDFLIQYSAICAAIKKYYENSPQSFDSVNQSKDKEFDFNGLPKVVIEILTIGTEMNHILADYIESGIKCGAVYPDIKPMQTVYVLWASISSLLTMVQNKGEFLQKEFCSTKDEFLEYGFKQIINSILKERI